MADPFTDHRKAALALINDGSVLDWKSGQFCGGLAFSEQPLSPRQRRWMVALLEKAGLPPLADGGGE